MKLTGTIVLLLTAFYLGACNQPAKAPTNGVMDKEKEEKQIAALLDSFNRAAARADFNTYFSYYGEDAIFAGTDATERWDKKAFMVWAKPYFDKGRAWDFTALNRHIYFHPTANNIAWFDELLNTQMKICRGSGVLVKTGDQWKLQQYILSTTIPNDQLDTILKIKAPVEDALIQQLMKQ